MKLAISFFLLLFSSAGYIPAQESTGVLRGMVTDQSGASIPGAVVTASQAGGQKRSAVAGDDGRYSFPGLPPGAWTIEAAAPGLAQASPAAITISGGNNTLDLRMRVAAERQEITVTDTVAPEVSLDPTQSASAQVLRSSDLEALADDPDDLMADLLALAGPAAGPDGGQIFIDGFTAGDGTLPSKDAIREIRINQNPFSPEFDTLGTGHIEILTKPGSDHFRGEAFFTYGDGLFNARNPYGTQKAPFSMRDFGGSLSGRINSKGSFFLDFDKRAIDMGDVVNGSTLNPQTLQIVSPFTQVAVTPLRRLYVGARVDYQLSAKNTLMVRYEPNLNTSRDAGIGSYTLPSEGFRSSLMEHALQATETMLIGSSTVNETRFQYRHQNYSQTPDSTDPSIIVVNAFNGGGALPGLHDYLHHHYEVQNYTTKTATSHTWRFGARLRAVSIVDTSEQNFNGTYVFGGAYAPVLDGNNQPVVPGVICNPATQTTGCTTISSIEQYRRTVLFGQMGMSSAMIRALGGGATQFSINAGDPVVYAGGADIGLFVGDDWKVKPNLTLSLGLRYETQDNIRDHADFAPRVAFAWAPAGSSKNATPKTVIRGGFGMFYTRFSEQNVLVAQRYNGISQQQFVVIDPDTYPAIPSTGALEGAGTQQILHTISSSLRTPYLMQSSIGVERQLPKNTTLAVSYVDSHGLHQLRSRNINAPLADGAYPYPTEGPIYEMESAGLYNQNQLVTTVNSRLTPKISLNGSYSFGYARSNTDGLGTFPANQYSMAGEYGPAANDVRNRMALGGSITSKLGLVWNPLVILQSGAPFNIITSQDVYNDTVLSARPGFATNPNQPGVIATSYGLFDPDPVAGEAIVPRNYGRGPGLFIVNLRLARAFVLREHLKLTLSVSARNLLNHLNPGPIIGNINSPLFGQSNQLGGGFGAYSDGANNRRLEFQARFAF
jgi:Carboxypeptidase regulatory-like domain